MKSEPDVYSIDDLERDGQEMWDSIRNYQARNMMRDDMRIGDEVFFYHSNCKEPAVVGIARVASEPYPDPTQFDESNKYFDPKSDPDNPRWYMVDVKFKAKFDRVVSLADLREAPELADMLVLRKGQRLSVMPVTKNEFAAVKKLATTLAKKNR